MNLKGVTFSAKPASLGIGQMQLFAPIPLLQHFPQDAVFLLAIFQRLLHLLQNVLRLLIRNRCHPCDKSG